MVVSGNVDVEQWLEASAPQNSFVNLCEKIKSEVAEVGVVINKTDQNGILIMNNVIFQLILFCA